VAAQLFWFFPSLEEHVNLLRKNTEFIEPQLLTRILSAVFPRHLIYSPSGITALYWITAIAGALALIGLLTRVSMFIFASGTWILVAHLFSYGDRHHTEAVFCIFLMMLAFSPSGDALSVDAYLRRKRGILPRYPAGMADTAIWPLKLTHVLLALTYFSAGMAKLITSGPRWMNGYTLQNHALQDAASRGFPVGIWVAQHHNLAIVLSVLTIFYEVFFFLSLVFPRTAPFFFLGGIGFHIGLYATGGYDFFQHMVLLALLLVFLAPPWWQAWLDRLWMVLRSRGSGAAEAPTAS
jgi:hypothetical protein